MSAPFQFSKSGPDHAPASKATGKRPGDTASITSNMSMATGAGSVTGILPRPQGEIVERVNPNQHPGRGGRVPPMKAMLKKKQVKEQRRKMFDLIEVAADAGDDSWYAALNLPTLYDEDNLREWLTAHCQSPSVLNRVKEVTKLVADAITTHAGSKAFRTAGSTARGTSEKQKVDVDLAFHCPNAASVKSMKDLLGPELAKRVEWERTKHVDHKHEDGSLSRRIFASIVLKEHPHLPVDIALFADQRDFDLQGEVLNRIQLELNYHPAAAQLAVAMKGVLRHGYCAYVKEHLNVRAAAPGIAIEIAAIHIARFKNEYEEVTPALLSFGLLTFATPSPALKADWSHPVYDFDTKSAAFEEARYGAQLLGRAIM